MKLSDIMTEEKFVAIGMRIVKLFHPFQPSDEEFLAVRMADNHPDDQFLLAAQNKNALAEKANQLFHLWFVTPEGHA